MTQAELDERYCDIPLKVRSYDLGRAVLTRLTVDMQRAVVKLAVLWIKRRRAIDSLEIEAEKRAAAAARHRGNRRATGFAREPAAHVCTT